MFTDRADEAEYVFLRLRRALATGDRQRAKMYGLRMAKLFREGSRTLSATIIGNHSMVLASLAMGRKDDAVRYMRREAELIVKAIDHARAPSPIWTFLPPSFVVSRLEGWSKILEEQNRPKERSRVLARVRRIRRMHHIP